MKEIYIQTSEEENSEEENSEEENNIKLFHESKPIYIVIFNSFGQWKFKDITIEEIYNKYKNIILSNPEHIKSTKDLSFNNIQRLDPESGTSKLCILIKTYTFLLCFDNLRFLVFPNKSYIVLIDGIDGEMNILKKFINYSNIPFNLRILIGFFEIIIGFEKYNDQEIYSILFKELFIIKEDTQKQSKGLEELRLLCQKCSRLKKRIDSFKKVIKNLLKNEDILLLFENYAIEYIFIYYLQCLGKIRSETKLITNKLKIERDNFIINLDTSRNRLLRIQLYFAIFTTFGVIATIPAAIGGMSEFNSLKFSYLFLIVTFLFVLGLPILGILLFIFILEFKKWLIF